MPIYRGDGGSAETSNNATANEVAQNAADAAASATAAAASATAAAASETAASASETAAETAETNAETAETNAASSATAAASSATSAASSATTATTQASAASTSATNAATSETNAATSATNAATSETNAATSATNAATSATNASNSASAAATSATNAATSETNAATSETNAATSATNAATSATNAAASYDDFDDRYLGAKSSDPSVDNDGDALLTGALYFNTTSNVMKVYTGSAWNAIADTLDSLTDVTITSASNGQVLKYNGSAWVNAADAGGIALTDLSVTTNAAGTAALSYNNANGVFSYTPPDLSGYLTSYTETDTLDSVTGRGATTTNSISVGGLTVDTDTLVVDSTNNAVGINTVTASGPQSTFHIEQNGDDADGGFRLSRDNALASYTQYINTSSTWNLAYGNPSSDDSPTNILSVTTSGNVGIGTTSPSPKFHVTDGDGGGARIDGGAAAAGESAYLWCQNGRARFGYDGGRGAVAISDYNQNGSTTSKAICFDTGGSERMRIASDGAVQFNGAIEEQQYSLTGTAIDPANGTIQYKTLGANTTFTESLSNGEFVTLMIDDGSAYTVTWPTTTWVGGSAPTLGTAGYNVIHLWHINSVLYGAFIGTTA